MMTTPAPANIEFSACWKALLTRKQHDWRLADSALCVAKQFYPALHMENYLQQLDEYKTILQQRLVAEMSTAERIAQINHLFFDELGYAINHADYFEPHNSFINDVVDSKRGIPVSLSVIWMDLAISIGLDAYGINFPGHFLVGVRAADRHWYLDMDKAGKDLTLTEIKLLLARQDRPDSHAVMDISMYLKPANQLTILVRMLRNLKKIYMDKSEVKFGLQTIALILSLIPESPDELRDRGMIYQHIDYTAGALADLTRYLQLVPDAQERALIESMMESLQQRPTQLH